VFVSDMYMNTGKITGRQKVKQRLKGLIEHRDSNKSGYYAKQTL